MHTSMTYLTLPYMYICRTSLQMKMIYAYIKDIPIVVLCLYDTANLKSDMYCVKLIEKY